MKFAEITSLRGMEHAISGTFPIVYPAAAAYFDVAGRCSLADERCNGPFVVHAFFTLELHRRPGSEDEPAAPPFLMVSEDYSKLPLLKRLTCDDPSGRPGFE